MACGNPKLSEMLRERLEGLGQALDQKQQLRVFDGGLVGFDNETESEVIENVTGKEARSAARPRPGRPARPRQQRPRRGEWWWPPGASGSLGAVAQLEWLGGLGSLVSAYPDTRAAIHGDHAWFAVPARPMGVEGPLAILVICYPEDARLKVRGWGFWVHGGWLAPMGTRHTNYPDQSICAFADDGTWTRSSGLQDQYRAIDERFPKRLHDPNFRPSRGSDEYARLEAYWFFCFSEWYATNRVNSDPLSDLWLNYYRPLVADGLEIPSLRYVLEDRVRSRGAGQGEWRNYLGELSVIARISGKPLSRDVEDKIRNDPVSN